MAVGFIATGALAFAITFGIRRIDRVESHIAGEQVFDRRTKVRFNSYSKLRVGGDFFLPALPTGWTVLDTEIGDNLSKGVNDDDIVMIAGPVEACEVSVFIFYFHGL